MSSRTSAISAVGLVRCECGSFTRESASLDTPFACFHKRKPHRSRVRQAAGAEQSERSLGVVVEADMERASHDGLAL